MEEYRDIVILAHLSFGFTLFLHLQIRMVAEKTMIATTTAANTVETMIIIFLSSPLVALPVLFEGSITPLVPLPVLLEGGVTILSFFVGADSKAV